LQKYQKVAGYKFVKLKKGCPIDKLENGHLMFMFLSVSRGIAE